MKSATLLIREARPGQSGTLPGTVPNKAIHTDADGKIIYVTPTVTDLTGLPPVDTVAVSPITLSGLQTLQGVAGQEGVVVAVINQLNRRFNGIYVMALGPWARHSAFNTGAHFDAAYGRDLLVKSGLFANARVGFLTQGPVTLESTEIVLGVSPNPPGPADEGKNVVVGPAGIGLAYVDGVSGQVQADAVFPVAVAHSGVPADYDGVTFTAGMTVLDVCESTDPVDRGLWTISAGPWTRVGGNAHSPGVVVTIKKGRAGRGTAWRLKVAGDFVLDSPTLGDQTWARADGGPTGRTQTASTALTLALQIETPAGCSWTYEIRCEAKLDDFSARNSWTIEVSGHTSLAGAVTVDGAPRIVPGVDTPTVASFDVEADASPTSQLLEVYVTASSASPTNVSVVERLLHQWEL